MKHIFKNSLTVDERNKIFIMLDSTLVKLADRV